MNKIRISIIPHTGKISDKVLRRCDYLADSLERLGHEVTVYELPRSGIRYYPIIGTIINTILYHLYVKSLKPDLIINQSFYQVYVNENIPVIYDLVDDHVVHLKSNSILRRFSSTFVEWFILRQLSSSCVATAVSNDLIDKYSIRSGRSIGLSPNGANVSKWRQIDCSSSKATTGPNLVYVGNHGSWSGMNFLLSLFVELKKVLPGSCLTIIGPVENETYVDGVQYTGKLSPYEVIPIVKSSHIGVIPFEMSEFTHASFPIKAIEYGAARIPVISVPLRSLESTKLPWINLVERNKEKWCSKIEYMWSIRGTCNWSDEFDKRVDEFDWDVIANNLICYFYDMSQGRKLNP